MLLDAFAQNPSEPFVWKSGQVWSVMPMGKVYSNCICSMTVNCTTCRYYVDHLPDKSEETHLPFKLCRHFLTPSPPNPLPSFTLAQSKRFLLPAPVLSPWSSPANRKNFCRSRKMRPPFKLCRHFLPPSPPNPSPSSAPEQSERVLRPEPVSSPSSSPAYRKNFCGSSGSEGASFPF